MRIQRLCFLHNLWRKGKEFGVYAIWICKEQYEKEPWNCKHNESLKVQQPLTNNIHEIPLVRELKITCCTLNHHPSKQKIGNFIPCYVKTKIYRIRHLWNPGSSSPSVTVFSSSNVVVWIHRQYKGAWKIFADRYQTSSTWLISYQEIQIFLLLPG